MKIFAIVNMNIFLVIGGIVFAFILLDLVFNIILSFMHAIALYVVAVKMDYQYPVFAFFPFLRDYLEYTIPQDEFKIFKLKIKNRKVVAAVIVILYYVVLDNIQIPIRPIHYLLRLFFSLIRIKRYYDMYFLIEKKYALVFAIFSEISKIFHIIVLIRYCNLLKKKRKVSENKLARINTFVINIIQTLIKPIVLVAPIIILINQQIIVSQNINEINSLSTPADYRTLIFKIILLISIYPFIFKTVFCFVMGIGHYITGYFTENKLFSNIIYLVSSWFVAIELIPLTFTIKMVFSVKAFNTAMIFGQMSKYFYIPFIILSLFSIVSLIINIICLIRSIVEVSKKSKESRLLKQNEIKAE